MVALGAFGVGLLTFLESVFPPIPSEVVLPLAGYLAERGRLELAAVFAAATTGAVLGAIVLYEGARKLGAERSAAALARLPIVDREDVERAITWFERKGTYAVLFGRMVPGVRSLISLPAGAARMPRWRFLVCTTIGTLGWNALLIGAGYVLGSQWQEAERYSDVLNYAIYVVIIATVAWWISRKRLARRAGHPRCNRKEALTGTPITSERAD